VCATARDGSRWLVTWRSDDHDQRPHPSLRPCREDARRPRADQALLPAEQDRIRDAADTLIFAAAHEDAQAAAADIEALAQHLAGTGRWSEERARELLDDVLACGPVSPVA
jgi:hypothetical protein